MASFRAYRRLDDPGLPRAGKRVSFRVRPKREGGEVIAWAVRFRVNVARRPYFDLSVRFRGRGECAEGGSAYYSFAIGGG